MENFNFISDMEFWFSILAVVGFIWCMTSFGKFIGNIIEKIKN